MAMSSFAAVLSAHKPSLPQHCTPTSPFLEAISLTFHSCIPTPAAFLSTLLGTLSITSWLFAQLPQIYKNYRIQSTAGLSIFFLVEWCLGDTTQLLGALFTHQAAWQVFLAGYYVFVDVCLVWQYFWYTHIKPSLDGQSLHSSNRSETGDFDEDSINGLSPINSHFRDEAFTPNTAGQSKPRESSEVTFPMATPQFSQTDWEKSPSRSHRNCRNPQKSPASSWLPSPSPRTLFYVSTSCALLSRANAAPLGSTPIEILTTTAPESHLEIAGRALSWLSTILYLISRLPQLYHNFTRKSTAGLSPLLFIAAFSGNFFYSTSLITNPLAWDSYPPHGGHGWAGPEGSERWEWVSLAAPFWLGAAGVLIMDGMMGVQFLLYADRDEEKLVRVRDGAGGGRWERVSGWMRGWVPSVKGKEKLVGLGESQRLLGESRDLDRGLYGGL